MKKKPWTSKLARNAWANLVFFQNFQLLRFYFIWSQDDMTSYLTRSHSFMFSRIGSDKLCSKIGAFAFERHPWKHGILPKIVLKSFNCAKSNHFDSTSISPRSHHQQLKRMCPIKFLEHYAWDKRASLRRQFSSNRISLLFNRNIKKIYKKFNHARIILNDLATAICSKLYWYNFPVPTQKSHFSVTLLLSELSVSLYH